MDRIFSRDRSVNTANFDSIWEAPTEAQQSEATNHLMAQASVHNRWTPETDPPSAFEQQLVQWQATNPGTDYSVNNALNRISDVYHNKSKNNTHLNLSDLGLNSLPECLSELENLTDLEIQNNQLQSLPLSMGALSQLEMLDCSNNPLTNLPENFENLSNLKEVLTSGQINRVAKNNPSLEQLQKLPQLQFLRIRKSAKYTSAQAGSRVVKRPDPRQVVSDIENVSTLINNQITKNLKVEAKKTNPFQAIQNARRNYRENVPQQASRPMQNNVPQELPRNVFSIPEPQRRDISNVTVPRAVNRTTDLQKQIIEKQTNLYHLEVSRQKLENVVRTQYELIRSQNQGYPNPLPHRPEHLTFHETYSNISPLTEPAHNPISAQQVFLRDLNRSIEEITTHMEQLVIVRQNQNVFIDAMTDEEAPTSNSYIPDALRQSNSIRFTHAAAQNRRPGIEEQPQSAARPPSQNQQAEDRIQLGIRPPSPMQSLSSATTVEENETLQSNNAEAINTVPQAPDEMAELRRQIEELQLENQNLRAAPVPQPPQINEVVNDNHVLRQAEDIASEALINRLIARDEQRELRLDNFDNNLNRLSTMMDTLIEQGTRENINNHPLQEINRNQREAIRVETVNENSSQE